MENTTGSVVVPKQFEIVINTYIGNGPRSLKKDTKYIHWIN